MDNIFASRASVKRYRGPRNETKGGQKIISKLNANTRKREFKKWTLLIKFDVVQGPLFVRGRQKEKRNKLRGAGTGQHVRLTSPLL